MRKFSLFFLVLLSFNLSVFSQIDSVSIQGIDCYNDTAFIKLDLANNSYILDADEWQYQPYDDTAWYFIDTSSLYQILSLIHI